MSIFFICKCGPHCLEPFTTMSLHQEWQNAIVKRLNEFVSVENFACNLNNLLQIHRARIAGGFIARCILQYQAASQQFFHKDKDFWNYQVERFLPSSSDIDIYVPNQNCAKFFEDFIAIIDTNKTMFHLSPAIGYKSFMRMNGILARVNLQFNNRNCDILSCKRQVSQIVQNFDISGVCVSWDGRVLHMNESIAQQMQLMSSHRFPQFQWSLNPDYIRHYAEGNKCTHKRIRKYTALGIQINIPLVTLAIDYQFLSCKYCDYSATYATWGTFRSSYCAKHAPPDSYYAHHIQTAARMIKNLFTVITMLSSNLSINKQMHMVQWKLKHCDPENLFEITAKSPLLQTIKAIYKMINMFDEGFLHWLCHAGSMTALTDYLSNEFFAEHSSCMPVNARADFEDCKMIFSFIIDQMISDEQYMQPLHSCEPSHAHSFFSKVLHSHIDWYVFFHSIHPMYSGTQITFWCLIYMDNYQRVCITHDLLTAIVDIAMNDACYQIIGEHLYPSFYCNSRGSKRAIKSDSWKTVFVNENPNKLIDIYLQNSK